MSATDAKKAVPAKSTKVKSRGQPVRLYTKASFVGFQRGLRKQSTHHALLQLEGVKSKSDVPFYLGKRCVYIYKAQRAINGTHYRSIWGRIARAHGSNGVVRAHFRTNLPPKAMGACIRVMLFPSRV